MAANFFQAAFFSVHFTTKAFRLRHGFGNTVRDRASALNLARHMAVASLYNKISETHHG